ncbi:ABC transporter ATP-binding protein [Clostridium sp. CX1]|uniref:ABC transporter ATP-binding protein n=1 Tax=Clostridium tanneri TaxID=3037988 RepID=A0ABU4JSM3_9CLOT|nr:MULTISPECIES: ABC transporter ATP-binding protein [unclassified Clostridium]MCT8976938.1 ABC transporter ATP-binding protein [Clostridium sp. CX1]MDW8801145.1 ABC transporter ATP-binding protein [Clostridium sp. A1-XYC3]
MNSILEVKNLNKSFKDFSLKNVSFSLPRGFIMGFIGPNGAGKSTTIKLIMNLLKKDSGEIKVFGLDNIKNEKEIKNKIGFVYDENYFYEELTISEMKNVIAPLYKFWDKDAFDKHIKNFELSPKKKIKDLSKGMKMKFSLAVALSHGAELLIMDEPTSGLDPLVRGELLDILSFLIQDENKGVFFSTHITSDLDKTADYITLLHNGEVLFSTAKDELLDSYTIIKGDKKLLNEAVKQNFIGIKENSFGFEGLLRDRNSIKTLFKDNVIVEKPTLEDIMLYSTRRSLND